ncbi:putative inner membrane domain protein, partial [Chlamydia psittaci 84-8471/1]
LETCSPCLQYHFLVRIITLFCPLLVMLKQHSPVIFGELSGYTIPS